MHVMRILSLGLALTAYAPHTCANTLDVNLLNIFYFEHASVSTNDCEARGFPSRSVYENWLKTNSPIHESISKEVLSDLMKKGLTKQQAEAVLVEIRGEYRLKSFKESRPSNTICGAFNKYLRGFSGLKNSRFASPQ